MFHSSTYCTCHNKCIFIIIIIIIITLNSSIPYLLHVLIFDIRYGKCRTPINTHTLLTNLSCQRNVYSESPGTGSPTNYIRRHLSTSAWAKMADKCARVETAGRCPVLRNFEVENPPPAPNELYTTVMS